MKKWLSSNKKLGFFLTVSLLATSTGFVLQQVHEQQLRTVAVSDLLYSYDFSDGGDSTNNNYTKTNQTSNISYATDNPSGSGTTLWEADWVNFNVTPNGGTRIGGKTPSTMQTDDATDWANIKTTFTIDSAVEKVVILSAKKFGTSTKVYDIYLQSTTSTTWTNEASTSLFSTTASSVTFDGLNIAAGSKIRIGVTKDDTGKTNSGLEFFGIQFYTPQSSSNPLTALTVSGTLTNTTQYAGNSFDPTGLTFTAQFGSGTGATYQNVTSDVTFTPDPLTAGTTSVTAHYVYGGVEKTCQVTGFNTINTPWSYGTYPVTGDGPANQAPITPTGSVPAGSTATLTTTFSTVDHITGGNYQLLEFNGYNNQVLKEIKLSAHSNASGGAGKFEYSYDGINWVTVIADSRFNTAGWNNAYTNTYVDIVKTVDIPIGSAGKFFLKITASENSLYCQSYTLKWQPKAMTDRTVTGISITTVPEVRRYIIGQTFNPLDLVVQATYDDTSVNNDFRDYYLSIPLGSVLNTLGTNIPVTVTVASNTTLTASYNIIEVVNPTALEIASTPTKLDYIVGETLNLSGLVVNARAGTWGELLNTSRYTTSPAEGATLSTAGPVTVTVTSTDVSTLKQTFTINVSSFSYTPSGADIIISEIYGGGGNSGAPYSHDYIELFNKTSLPIDLSTYSLQYGSATTTTAFSQITSLSGTIPAKGYFLIRLSTNNSNVGDPLDTPDAISNTNMSATNGKIAIVLGSSAITNSTDAAVVDFVGFGTANDYEGTGTANAPSNTTSISRKMDPAIHEPIDTDDNSFDFNDPTTVLSPVNTQSSFYEQFMRLTSNPSICTATDWGYLDDNYNALTDTGKTYFANKPDAVARHNYLVGVNTNLPALDIALLSLVNSLVTPNSLETITVVVITLAGINLLAYFYFVKRKRRYLN